MVYGRSGAGKTTLLQLIAGMRDPTSGTVSIRDGNGMLAVAAIYPCTWAFASLHHQQRLHKLSAAAVAKS